MLKKLLNKTIDIALFVLFMSLIMRSYDSANSISQFGFALMNAKEFSYAGCNAGLDKRDIALCDWTDKTIKYYNEKCNGCLIKKENKRQIYVSFDELGDGIMGYAIMHNTQCYVSLQNKYIWESDPVEFRLTLFHEIGHCIGFMHEKSDRSIMYASSSYLHNDNTVLEFVTGRMKERLTKGFVFFKFNLQK